MRLPAPIKIGGDIYIECEVSRPTPETIANTAKEVQENRIYTGLYIFVSNCVSLLKTDKDSITDKVKIKDILRNATYKTIEYLSIQILLLHYNNEDGIEGVYKCPRCGTQIISEVKKDSEENVISDTRDYISDLKIVYLENSNGGIPVELKEGIVIKEENIIKLDISYPTIQHCINAENKVGITNQGKLQFNILGEALKKVNDREVDFKFRNTWGEYIFSKMPDMNDLNKILKEIDKHGYNREVKKNCGNCGKEWMASLSTSNFFDSALQR